MSDEQKEELVTAVGFDVTAMTELDLIEAGVTFIGRGVVTVPDGKPWMTHEQYARRDPAAEEKAKRYARLAAYLHLERQYLRVDCPRCGRYRGRPCKLAVGPTGARIGYPHRERRTAAEAEQIVSLRGLKLERAFPCDGTFRVAEQAGRVVLVQCDRCGFELGVAPPKPGEKAEGDEWPQDDIPL